MNEYFSLRLKHLREKHGLSQAELADKIGVSRGSISFYENNSRVPDIDVLCSLCDFFSVSSDYLLGRSDQVVPSYSSASALLGIDQNTLSPATREACAEFQSAFHQLYSKATSLGEKYFSASAICATDLVDILTELLVGFEDYASTYYLDAQAAYILGFYNSLPKEEQDKLAASSETFKKLIAETGNFHDAMKQRPVETYHCVANALIEKASGRLGIFALRLGAELSELPNAPTISDAPEPPEA